MAKPIAGSWGWHAEHGLGHVTGFTHIRGQYSHFSMRFDGSDGFSVSHIVPAASVTILLHRDDLIALANQVRQAQGT